MFTDTTGTVLLSAHGAFSENRAVNDIMSKKCGGAAGATDENIIQRMRFACWISKATDTHLEYLILIAFPQ
jgi:hypothetical protein